MLFESIPSSSSSSSTHASASSAVPKKETSKSFCRPLNPCLKSPTTSFVRRYHSSQVRKAVLEQNISREVNDRRTNTIHLPYHHILSEAHTNPDRIEIADPLRYDTSLLARISSTLGRTILALSLQDSLISSLWQFLCKIGPTCGLKELLKIYEMSKEHQHPIFDLLQLFCNLCSYLVT